MKMTRLSCHGFRSNEVRLGLSVLAYNLGRLVLPRRIDGWSLTSLQHRSVKTGGRLVKHARYYWLLLAESHRRGDCLRRWCEGLPPCRWRRGRGRRRVQRKSNDRAVRAGEVSMERTGKAGFAGFGFLRQSEGCAC